MKETVKKQLSIFEERLELLGAVPSVPSSLVQELGERFKSLQSSVQDEVLRQKSLPADELLSRIAKVVLDAARKESYEMCLSFRGIGSVSLPMVESAMAAMLASVTAALQRYRGYTRAERMRDRLFRPYSLHIEVQGNKDQIRFRLLHDGRASPSAEDFSAVRQHVAARGGWFLHRNHSRYGGLIEFRIPLDQERPRCHVLRFGNFSVAIPDAYIFSRDNAAPPEGTLLLRLDEAEGLQQAEGGSQYVRVGVADFEFVFACDGADEGIRVRRVSDPDLLEPGGWYSLLGVVQEDGAAKVLPFIDGSTLLAFHRSLVE